jgi:hypothetical protein
MLSTLQLSVPGKSLKLSNKLPPPTGGIIGFVSMYLRSTQLSKRKKRHFVWLSWIYPVERSCDIRPQIIPQFPINCARLSKRRLISIRRIEITFPSTHQLMTERCVGCQCDPTLKLPPYLKGHKYVDCKMPSRFSRNDAISFNFSLGYWLLLCKIR